MKSKARMNNMMPLAMHQSATQPKKLNSDTYFSKHRGGIRGLKSFIR